MLYQDKNEDVKGAHPEKETKQEQTDRLKGQLKRNADKLREAREKEEYWRSIGQIQEDMMEDQKEWQPIPVQEGEEAWKKNERGWEKSFESALDETLAEVKAMLMEKNTSYGNSLLDPVRAFSKASVADRIGVRLDDKLSRMIKGEGFPGDNDKRDMLG